MCQAIDTARRSVRLEMYIYHPQGPGAVVREALTAAARRGVTVKVLVDAIGSDQLNNEYWEPLAAAGGEHRWFNPFHLRRVAIRNHRKLLVCDGQLAIAGGFNLMPEIEGDGLARGWRDLAIELQGPLAGELAVSFDEMFALADFRHGRFARFRRNRARHACTTPHAELLFSGPGRGRHPIKAALHRDLAQANNVCIAMAYFVPTWRIRRLLARVARRGGRVRLLLPARSDVALAQLASRRIYSSLLRAGVEVHEFQPQVLHTKLLVIDGVTYVGSANLDHRSLHINYELMLRFTDPAIAREACARFDADLAHAARVDSQAWRRSRTLWEKLKEYWAWTVLVHWDATFARWQTKRLGRG
jgi:cardiolipin synthase A/B